MSQTPKQMREDALVWAHAKFPAVAVGRYRDAADRIQALETALREAAVRLRTAAIAGGTAPEYADLAVAKYVQLLEGRS
jgi:hypothetical protein